MEPRNISVQLLTKLQVKRLFRGWNCDQNVPAKGKAVIIAFPRGGEWDHATFTWTPQKSVDKKQRLYKLTLTRGGIAPNQPYPCKPECETETEFYKRLDGRYLFELNREDFKQHCEYSYNAGGLRREKMLKMKLETEKDRDGWYDRNGTID